MTRRQLLASLGAMAVGGGRAVASPSVGKANVCSRADHVHTVVLGGPRGILPPNQVGSTVFAVAYFGSRLEWGRAMAVQAMDINSSFPKL